MGANRRPFGVRSGAVRSGPGSGSPGDDLCNNDPEQLRLTLLANGQLGSAEFTLGVRAVLSASLRQNEVADLPTVARFRSSQGN